MLSVLEARGLAAATLAAARARVRVANVLREILPGVAVRIEGTQVVLIGRLDLDDAELRWLGSLLR